MTTHTKTLLAVIATGLLANCSGIGGGGSNDGAGLTVRDGPQSQVPYSVVAPAAVILTDT